MKRQGVKLFGICVTVALICCSSVSGDTITIDKVPYAVQLRDPSGYTFCSGTLVTSQHVVTAASCFPDAFFAPVTVVAGATSRYAAGISRRIEKLTIHPGYDKPTRMNNDVAVVKLSEPLPLGENIQIMEKLCSQSWDGRVLLEVPVWGRKGKTGVDAEPLYTVQLPTLSSEDCVAKVGVSDSMLCIYGGSPDICIHDAGGPGIYGGEFCAIVSWGEFCGRANNPGVLTNVKAVRDFITENIKA